MNAGQVRCCTVFHPELPILHVLCYTIAHEGCGFFRVGLVALTITERPDPSILFGFVQDVLWSYTRKVEGAEELSEQYGGENKKWQHVKAVATIDTPGGTEWQTFIGSPMNRLGRQGTRLRGGWMKVKYTGETSFLIATNGKVYDVLSIEKGWYRIVDDSGDDYLYPPEMFEVIEA